MTDQLTISEAIHGDAPLISLLGRITFTETFGHLFRDPQDLQTYYEKTFSVAKIERSLSDKRNVYWVAYMNRLPVGYAKLKLDTASEFLKEEHICQLQKIYVLKDFLSKKIGHHLQEKLLARATESGYKKIWLSVLKENSRAVNFYLKSGFDPIGEHEYVIGKEHFNFISMAKNLY